MSVSVVASSDGNSAIIKVNGVERLKINADGSITATGSPAAGVRGNVLATMQAFSTEFTAQKAENGYLKMPNGLILQWCKGVSVPAAGTAVTTLPTTFDIACLFATAIGFGLSQGVAEIVAKSINSVTVGSGNNTAVSTPLIFAIGY